MRKLGRFAVMGIAALVLMGLGASGSSAPQVEASETTVTLTWGAFTVAANDDTPQFVVEGPKLSKPCTNCYITSLTPELEVDTDPTAGQNWVVANYSSVPPARLHHMVLFNHAYVDPTCAGSGMPIEIFGDRWFASGDERGTLSFPAGYGYYLPAALVPDQVSYWTMQVMIHNLSFSQQDFRLRMTFKYQPATDNLKPVRHLWLDQNNCDTSQYPVTAGYNDDHWTWTVGSAAGIEGRIFEMGGHVHDYGLSVAGTIMKAATPTTENLICASLGGYAAGSALAPGPIGSNTGPAAAHPPDEMTLTAFTTPPADPAYDGHIEAMTGCVSSTMIAPGDTLRLHTQYVAIGGIPDVMGIMGAWVYDNCPSIPNPTQEDVLDGGDDYGDACDADADGDGACNTGAQGPGGYSCSGTDVDDDGDGYTEEAENGTPLCSGSVNDDNADDAVVNDGCPGGPAKEGTFSEADFRIGTNGLARCSVGTLPAGASPSWPSDFASGSVPNSTDRVNILDMSSFLAPARRLDTNPGNANFNARWDISPGKGVFGNFINVSDLSTLIAGSSGFPPMFGGAKAFGGPLCTGS